MQTKRALITLALVILPAGLGYAIGVALADVDGQGRSVNGGGSSRAGTAELHGELGALETKIVQLKEQINERAGAQASVPAAPPSPRVEELRARLDELKAELQKAPEAPKPPSLAEQIDAAVGRFYEALALEDGRKAMAAMGELCRLGEDAYSELLELWNEMEEREWLGINRFARRGWADLAFFHWALENPSLGLDPERAQELLRTAVVSLRFLENKSSKRGESYLALLGRLGAPEPREGSQRRRPGGRFGGFAALGERDLYRLTLSQLVDVKSETVAQHLAGIARDASFPTDVRETALNGLVGQPGDDASAVAASLTGDADEAIAKAAATVQQKLDSPATGYSISSVTDDSQAAKLGMPVGGIIVSYDGKPVSSGRDMFRLPRRAQGPTAIVEMYQDGGLKKYTVQTKDRLGIDGDFVKKRGD